VTPHTVHPVPTAGCYLVVSGRSGSRYVVTPQGGQTATCTCPAGQHRTLCDHVRAVYEHVGREQAERVKASVAPFRASNANAFARLDAARAHENRRPRQLTPDEQRRLDTLLSEK
jgi:uncharacterized Zn finger protein